MDASYLQFGNILRSAHVPFNPFSAQIQQSIACKIYKGCNDCIPQKLPPHRHGFCNSYKSDDIDDTESLFAELRILQTIIIADGTIIQENMHF